jgi:hypothetical protein
LCGGLWVGIFVARYFAVAPCLLYKNGKFTPLGLRCTATDQG